MASMAAAMPPRGPSPWNTSRMTRSRGTSSTVQSRFSWREISELAGAEALQGARGLVAPEGLPVEFNEGLGPAHAGGGPAGEEERREVGAHGGDARRTPSERIRARRPPLPFRKDSAPGPKALSIQ